jgi:hypothetical protein
MRKPRNRSDSSRLPTGTITFAADPALPAQSEVTAVDPKYTTLNLLHGGEVVVVSPTDTTMWPPNLAYVGAISPGGAVMVKMIHSGVAALNFPGQVVRYIVLPP